MFLMLLRNFVGTYKAFINIPEQVSFLQVITKDMS